MLQQWVFFSQTTETSKPHMYALPSGFLMTVMKPKWNYLSGQSQHANNALNQSELIEKTCNRHQARENVYTGAKRGKTYTLAPSAGKRIHWR